MGRGLHTVLTYRQRVLGHPGEALKSLLGRDRGGLE